MESGPKEEINHALQQIGRSYVCRKYHNWPLYPISQWSELFWAGGPDLKDVNIGKCSYILKKGDVHRASTIENSKNRNEELEVLIPKLLNRKFRAVQPILDKYGNKMALCGGFFSSQCSSNDVDFFFYDCTTEEAELMVIDCVEIILSIKHVSGWSNVKLDNHLIRSENTTSVMLSYYHSNSNQTHPYMYYQFIHRIYPSLGSIMGGFDIPASMVCYNGKEILATEQGAWCLTNNIMVMDISRRSTTFCKRMSKYQGRGFDVVFPGCDMSSVFKVLEESKGSREKFLNNFYSFAQSFNIRFKCTAPENVYHDDYFGTGLTKCSTEDKLFSIDTQYMFQDVIYSVHHYDGRVDVALNDDKMRIKSSLEPFDYDISIMEKHDINSTCFINENYEALIAVMKLEANYDVKHAFQNPEVKIFDDPSLTNIDILNKVIEDAENRLRTLQWMTQDPQRQWSSTVNPAILKADDFYMGKWNGCGAVLSEPVESLLRLARKDSSNIWHTVPKDVFDLIISKIPYL